MTLEPQRAQGAGVQIQPLVQAEKGYWGEVDYNSDDPAKASVRPKSRPRGAIDDRGFDRKGR
jgi:hypothetical protein